MRRAGLTEIEELPDRNPACPEKQLPDPRICPPRAEPRISGRDGIGGKGARRFRTGQIGKQGGEASNVDPAVHLSLAICIPSPSELVQPG